MCIRDRYFIDAIQKNVPYSPQVITAIEMIGNTDVVPYLIQIVKDDKPFAINAVKALGNLKDKRAVPILMKVVKEKRPYDVDAVIALGKIGDKRAIPLLMKHFLIPAEKEPEKVLLKVIQEGKDPQKAGIHERIFDVERNLPPKIEINNFHIDPTGKVYVNYRLDDIELDTLYITPEYSEDGGITWKPATVEGKIEKFTGVIYSNKLVWRSDLDSIDISPQTKLIFRITPSDRKENKYRGIPAFLNLKVDYVPVGIKNIEKEVTGDITIVVYYPEPSGSKEKKFYFNYSFNNGRNWFPATVYKTTPPGLSTPDSLWYIWRSEEDLKGDDFSNILLRVSSYGDATIGRVAISKPFHVDNNQPPSIQILRTRENEFFEIYYKISDPEEDLISLQVDYSTNEGRSWQRATISGDLTNLSPVDYEGVIHWYSDFDVTSVERNKPVKIRIIPKDRDRGIPVISRDLLLNDPFYSKLTKGEETGDISVRYNFALDDTTSPITQYSIDGGKTWENASITDMKIEKAQNFKKAGINWAMGKDINGYHKRMEAVAFSLDYIGDEKIVPQLLKILTKRKSPIMSERQRAIEAARLFEKRPQWIINGLINSLISEDPEVHTTAVQILETIDKPDVKAALKDYYAYWDQIHRDEKEALAMKKENQYQEIIAEAARKRIPSRQELLDFMNRQGITTQEALGYFRDLDYCLLYTSPSPRDLSTSRMPSSA